jgi:hypothetical protein
MVQILIRVKAKVYDCYDHCSSDCDLIHEEVSFETLLKENKVSLEASGYLNVNPDKEKLPQSTIDILKMFGWVHAKTVTSRDEKKKFSQEYYLTRKYGHNGVMAEVIDIDNLNDYQLNEMAKDDSKIMQVVELKTVLKDADFKKLQEKKEKIAEAKKKKIEAKAKKLSSTKEKQIAAAKKLLEEAGIKEI